MTPVVSRVLQARIVWRWRAKLGAVWPLTNAIAFLVAEARGVGTGSYHLRGGGIVVIRHGTRDVAILREVLGPRATYRTPSGVRGLLRGPLCILDLGGNIGLFGVFALRTWDVAELVSLEPDPDSYARLRDVAKLNRPDGRWEVCSMAAAAQSGPVRFRSGFFSESRRADDCEAAIDVRGYDVFGHDPVDLLKIDIEGDEWEILTDSRLALFARAMSFWNGTGATRRPQTPAPKRRPPPIRRLHRSRTTPAPGDVRPALGLPLTA